MECKRCHNKNRLLFKNIYCPNCTDCYYCIKCAHISIFKICQNINTELKFTKSCVDYNLTYKLTSNQQRLSNELIKKIKDKHIFINATCGAGKTEILFELVKQFINTKKKVCFVSPRIEVTTDIYLRFNKTFNTVFGIYTGERKILEGAMFFMTCNQLINFQNYFDLLIVDEVDAFPLHGDKVLYQGLFNSITKTGRLVFMSATPIKINKSFTQLNLNERYHKQKLPIPIYESLSISKLQSFLNTDNWIVFFPTITELNIVYEKIADEKIIICHSKIDNITNKLSSLQTNYIIFSTAVLERGITLSSVNVVVYNASHKNYELNTLIQISGRVGRVYPYTDGKIIFMTNQYSIATKKCIKHLERLNG